MKRFISVLLVIALLVPMLCVDVFAAEKKVNNFDELKTAIASAQEGDVITVSGDITITQTLMITKNITIKSDGTKTLTSGPLKMDSIEGCNMFYVPDGKTLSLDNITLDGANEARLIRAKGAKLNLTNVIMKNGSTEFLQQTPSNDQVYSGGAILAEESSKVVINGGSFENNNTGTKKLDGTRAAEGGAIKIDSSVITITGTKFEGNHLDDWNTEGGRQGGAIEATNTKAVINNATFNIPGPFNTGGAIKFENCKDAKVTGSTFTIDENKGQFGVAGGAITSQNSNLTIEKSNFKAGKGTRVEEAGGLIQVVGSGAFNLTGSTLEGSGAWFNGGKDGLYTANTGGAISFYDGSTVTANITDTTIKNIMANGNGAGIALSKGNGHKSSVKLTLKNTTIQNAAVYTYGANSYGGCIYIGEGNTVKIDGGKINGQTTSNIAAGIYNMGDLEITGGAQITGNTAYQMVGGIYHGGNRLKIDEANISGNQKGDDSTGHNHYIEGKEKSGINIYADKDVIITPKAKFDDNDVRVFDGQSSILLTGKLTKKINVSISEKEKTTTSTNANIKVFEEGQHRKVGYVVAKGDGTYTPSEEDAKQIHYLSKDTSQAIADFADHTSPGKWDFVLNPETKEIVLGQRVKLTLVPNGISGSIAKFENVETKKDVNKGIQTTLLSNGSKEDVYDVYKPGQKLAELTPEPVRQGYAFTGWYKEEKVNDNAPDKGEDGKTLVEELDLIKGFPAMSTLSLHSNSNFEETNEADITTIINPPEYTLYAGWEKVILVEKVWDDEDNKYGNRPDSIKVTLYGGKVLSAGPIELTAENGWKGEFKNIRPSKFRYTVKENPKQSPGYEEGVVTGDDKKGFVVTNKTEFITISGSKEWDHTGNDGDKPTTVTVNLLENGKKIKEASGESWEFKELPKYKNKQEVKYTLTENPVENYTSSQDGYNFKNTYTDKFKVHYVFKAKDTDKSLPKAIDGFKPTDDTEYKDGSDVTPKALTTTTYEDTDNDGTWTFDGWDKQKDKINKADVTFTGYWTFEEKTSDFTITKTVDKATYEDVGDELNYTITVTNTGEKDLTKLKLTDQLVKVTNQEFDLSLAEKTKVFTYKYTVTEDDVKAESITNTAKVKHGEKEKEASATSTLIKKKSDFTITKTVDKATYEKAGDILTYTVVVKNTGEANLTGLTISDSLVKLDEKPFNLAKGKSETFTYTYTITEADVTAKSVTNVASVKLGKDGKPKEATAKSILKEKEKRGDVYVRYETEDGKILDEFAVLIDAPVGTYYYTEEKAFPRYRFVGLAPYSDPAEGYVVEGTQYVVYLYRRDRGGRTPDRRDRYEREEKEVEEPTVEAKRKPELNKKDHKQYMYGYPDWTFVPAANITRGEAAAMFARLFKEYPGLDYNYKKYYTDVDESYWGFKEVAYLSEFGILSGYSDGTFRPNNKITRAEFVKIAESFEALTWGLSPYNDVDGGHWAFRYIVSSAAKGWISGYPDGSFRPNSFISRAEAVTIVNRLLERRPDKDYIDTHKPELKPFTDLKPSYWAYYEIYEAVDGHDYNRSFTDIEEHWYRLNNERFVFSQPRYYRQKIYLGGIYEENYKYANGSRDAAMLSSSAIDGGRC